MPEWTKKNFGRLRDQSPRDAPMQWTMARDALGSPELGVSRFTYWRIGGPHVDAGLVLLRVGW
jgi:hypothetical protein